MKPVFLILLVIVVAVLGAALWVRLAPSDPSVWHVDPVTAPDPGKGNARVVPPEAPVFDVTPGELMARVDLVAMAEPRVTRLAGSVDEGFVTYIARSRLWGFPDYVSVRTFPAEGGGATLAIFSRQRFGREDLGVNQARVDRWLAALAP